MQKIKKEIILQEIKLSYYEAGSGELLLFLHGGRVRALTFHKILDELSQKYHVIAPDIPGYGDSSTPKEIWSFYEYAKFFQLFLKTLKIEQVTVIGYSMGGGIACNLSLITKKIKKLVLIDSAGIEKTSGSELKRDFDRLLFYLSHPQYSLTFFILIKEWLLFILKHLMNFRHIKSIRKGLNNSYGYPSNMKIPTSIIWAKDDKIFPVEIAQKLYKLTKNSQLFIVNGNHDWILYKHFQFMKYLNKCI